MTNGRDAPFKKETRPIQCLEVSKAISPLRDGAIRSMSARFVSDIRMCFDSRKYSRSLRRNGNGTDSRLMNRLSSSINAWKAFSSGLNDETTPQKVPMTLAQ